MKGVMGIGGKSTPRSCSMLIPFINSLALLACLQLSLIGCSPLSLGKPCGEGSVTLLMFLLESGVGGSQGVRESGFDRRLLTRLFTVFYFFLYCYVRSSKVSALHYRCNECQIYLGGGGRFGRRQEK